MTKVHIVCSPSCATTAKEIENLINTGWKLQGDLVISNSTDLRSFNSGKGSSASVIHYFTQMMIKEDN